MRKQKPTYLNRKSRDEVNKKAILWTAVSAVVVVAAMALLLIFNP